MYETRTVSVNQVHYNSFDRRFRYIVFILIFIIIVLASVLSISLIYRTFKSGIKRKSLSIDEKDSIEFIELDRECQYGQTDCKYDATCLADNQCHCIFNCTNIHNKTSESSYLNSCQFNRDRCYSYYKNKHELTCSSMNCSHGAKCLIDDNGFFQCSCPNDCHEYLNDISTSESVCGSDHETYETLCDLNKRSCKLQRSISIIHMGRCQHCQDLKCIVNNQLCNAYLDCFRTSYDPLCANNFHSYSNECEMNKYSCQSNVNLTKLHDGLCYIYEKMQLREVCANVICSHGKTCMIENGIGVCRCLFNCSYEQDEMCASNGVIYRNLCEMKRESCIRGELNIPVDMSYCLKVCNATNCPYGQCKRQLSGQTICECRSCLLKDSHEDTVCGDNGLTYPSMCHLEYDACKKQTNIKSLYMGQCFTCRNVICPFHGQCQAQQDGYICICPSKDNCPSVLRDNDSLRICGSNQEIFYSQCEMMVRSCELDTHIYAIAPEYCIHNENHIEYNFECGENESLFDFSLNQYVECDAFQRCPINSYCNKQTNRCCVKILTAILPYRTCLTDQNCGRNMICLNGICQCARTDLIPARGKRECIAHLPYLFADTNCSDSPFGCCQDNRTISPSSDRRGCPEHCNCHPTGSLSLSCDPQSDLCHCRPGIGGSSCSYCENDYWGFTRILTHNNTGCIPCGCHPYGSVGSHCMEDTGQCPCHSFATGRQCDKCSDSSLVLTEYGCRNRMYKESTCADFTCHFNGICQMIIHQATCTCENMTCTHDERELRNICASNGRTYQSKCHMRKEQCLQQYQISLSYYGNCSSNDNNVQLKENQYVFDDELTSISVDSKRCITDRDCEENMVCLSDFCECVKQKYKRIPGSGCVLFEFNITNGICHEEIDGTYKCLCSAGWQGVHCDQKIKVNIPYFNRQSFIGIESQTSIEHLDLYFTIEHDHGLLLYMENESNKLDIYILIQNRTVFMSIYSNYINLTFDLLATIELNTLIRFQIYFLHNEIQMKLNNEKMISKLLPLIISLKRKFYLGGIPDYNYSFYSNFNINEGLQGCIHQLFVNRKRIQLNPSEHISKDINECQSKLCQNDECLNNDNELIDQCLIESCEINVQPNDTICICRNCSLNNESSIRFHANSYVKHKPLEFWKEQQQFQVEFSFLSESSSGLIIYSEHVNPKKGHMKLYLLRKMIVFNLIIDGKNILLSSRYPIELNKWHRCLIEIDLYKIILLIDQDLPVISHDLFSINNLWPRSFTFIGHLPYEYRPNNSLFLFDSFRGAIRNFIVNKQSLNDIRKDAFTLHNVTMDNGRSCQSRSCSINRTCNESSIINNIPLEFDGIINTVYPYVPVNLNQNYFRLLLKTKSSHGLIFYIGETSLSFFSKYLSLLLINGSMQFAVKINRNASLVLVKSNVRVDDGQWHRIEIERFRRRIRMKIDNYHQYEAASLSLLTEFSPNPSYIYIGGYNRLCGYDEDHCRTFRGCLQNVTIDNRYLNLINDEILQQKSFKPCHDSFA